MRPFKVFFGNVEHAAIASGNLFDNPGGVGLPVFRESLEFFDFEDFHHAVSIAQRAWRIGAANPPSARGLASLGCTSSQLNLL